jgi:hypothetical protein
MIVMFNEAAEPAETGPLPVNDRSGCKAGREYRRTNPPLPRGTT